jgi:hypothetical protein
MVGVHLAQLAAGAVPLPGPRWYDDAPFVVLALVLATAALHAGRDRHRADRTRPRNTGSSPTANRLDPGGIPGHEGSP